MFLENTGTFCCTLKLTCTKLVLKIANFSRIFLMLKLIKFACFPLIISDLLWSLWALKNLYTLLEWWVTRAVWHRNFYFRQTHLSALYWWCVSVLCITVKFGKNIKVKKNRPSDSVGWPVAVVCPGSTKQVWSSPCLLSLIILAKAIIAVWV